MEKRSFFSHWTKYLKKNFKDDLIIFVEPTRYKKRRVKKIKNLTIDEMNNLIKDFDNSVAFCLCDPDSYIPRVRDRLQDRIDNEKIQEDRVPENYPDLSDTETLKFAEESYSLLGALKNNVKKPPFLFIDIDLADQVPILAKRGMLPDENISNKDDMKEYMLNNMHSQEKLNMIDSLFNLEQLVDETDPNLVLFSGNGLHIWYSLPTDIQIHMNKYAALFDSFLKIFESNNLLNGLIVDENCKDINRNLRLPFTVNRKSNLSPRNCV